MQAIREYLPPHEVNFIVYHANCSDGLGAALCAYLKLGESPMYSAAKHQPAGREDSMILAAINYFHEKRLDEKINMVLVDFCYPRDFLLKLRGLVHRLIVLDHHVTAMNSCGDLDFCYFDMHRSGAVLAWDYWHGTQPVPLLIQYIQDRDLWQWKMPHSHEFSSGMDCYYPPATTPLSKLAEFIVDGCDNTALIEEMISDGHVISTYVSQQMERAKRNAHLFTSQSGIKFALVNDASNVSLLGSMLAKEVDYALMFHWDPPNDWKVSIRTDATKSPDASQLALKFGGGGHKPAAAFTWTKSFDELYQALQAM